MTIAYEFWKEPHWVCASLDDCTKHVQAAYEFAGKLPNKQLGEHVCQVRSFLTNIIYLFSLTSTYHCESFKIFVHGDGKNDEDFEYMKAYSYIYKNDEYLDILSVVLDGTLPETDKCQRLK